jgi:hypothetical protein
VYTNYGSTQNQPLPVLPGIFSVPILGDLLQQTVYVQVSAVNEYGEGPRSETLQYPT